MKGTVESNWKRINNVFNRLDEIKAKVETEFPSFEFVYRVRYFRDQFSLIKSELEGFFNESNVVPTAVEMRSTYPKVRRSILFYFLLSEMVFQHFVHDQDLVKTIRFADRLKEILRDYETRGELVIANLFRNILAHIRPFDDETLTYEASVLKGEYKVRFRYEVSRTDWKKLIVKLQSPKNTEPAKTNGLAVVGRNSYQIYNPETNENETHYTLMPIIAAGIETIFDLLNVVERLYTEVHHDEIQKRETLLNEESQLEEWLQSQGVGPSEQ